MLSKQSIGLLGVLCDLCNDEKFKIFEIEFIKNTVKDADVKANLPQFLRELKNNGCVDIKYEDAIEICFAITSKGRDDYSELKAIDVTTLVEGAKVKVSATKKPVMVVPEEKTEEVKASLLPVVVEPPKPKKIGLKMYFATMLGTLTSGGILMGIYYVLKLFNIM